MQSITPSNNGRCRVSLRHPSRAQCIPEISASKLSQCCVEKAAITRPDLGSVDAAEDQMGPGIVEASLVPAWSDPKPGGRVVRSTIPDVSHGYLVLYERRWNGSKGRQRGRRPPQHPGSMYVAFTIPTLRPCAGSSGASTGS